MNSSHASFGRQSDQALMKLVSAGDVRAFEAIYDRHHVAAYSLARSITSRAEEATQDAFLCLWRQASSFDSTRGTLATWLFTLVRHRSIDWVRRVQRQTRLQDLNEGAAETVEAPDRTEEQVLDADEFRRTSQLIDDLPAAQREVILLSYFEGYTHNEIAAKVGVPLGTVKGRARLGLDKLRSADERAPATGRIGPGRQPRATLIPA